ncbi:hypothetical protein [Niabella soli]|nr:hypothetical protein [Niabella soli]
MSYFCIMIEDKYDSHIYKPLMAGLFAGYLATVLNLIYDVAFREYTSFPLHEMINVSTIIFATLLVLAVAGCIYALIDRFSKNSAPVYTILSAVFTLLLVYGTLQVHRSDNSMLTSQFHGLLLGIVLITGIFATFLIPYFVKHSKLFM